LPKYKLEKGKRVNKDERREAKQDTFDKINKINPQNCIVQKMAARAHKIADASSLSWFLLTGQGIVI
jgi:hypothetical protein